MVESVPLPVVRDPPNPLLAPGMSQTKRVPKEEDDDVEVVPIPLDRETIERLIRLARLVGMHPVGCASSLLHDLMRDDEVTNVCALDASTHLQ